MCPGERPRRSQLSLRGSATRTATAAAASHPSTLASDIQARDPDNADTDVEASNDDDRRRPLERRQVDEKKNFDENSQELETSGHRRLSSERRLRDVGIEPRATIPQRQFDSDRDEGEDDAAEERGVDRHRRGSIFAKDGSEAERWAEQRPERQLRRHPWWPELAELVARPEAPGAIGDGFWGRGNFRLSKI